MAAVLDAYMGWRGDAELERGREGSNPLGAEVAAGAGEARAVSDFISRSEPTGIREETPH